MNVAKRNLFLSLALLRSVQSESLQNTRCIEDLRIEELQIEFETFKRFLWKIWRIENYIENAMKSDAAEIKMLLFQNKGSRNI